MKKLILLMALIFSTSCAGGSKRLTPAHIEFDKEFLELKRQFISESNGKITERDFKDITMGFRKYPKGSNVIGTCWPMKFFTEIDINKKEWDKNHDVLWRKELVYHEFGHCVMSRNHSEITESKGFFGAIERFAFAIGWWTPKGYLKDKCPASLMHPEMIGDRCFSKHYNYYIAELYTEYNPIRLFRFDFNRNFNKQSKSKCQKAEVTNLTKTWTKLDQETLNRAYRTCINTYNSCLKRFVKKEELLYQAICGEF